MKTQNPMLDNHRSFAIEEARRQAGKTRMVDFSKVVTLVNRRYRRKYSIYQISALLGSQGFMNNNPTRPRRKSI